MSAFQERVALRRILQDFVLRLDETIVNSTAVDDASADLVSSKPEIPVLCRFCTDNIVIWKDRQHVFCPGTYNLLKEFFAAPKMMLSKEDIRQDVLFAEDASEGSIRQCILKARKELRRCQFPYRIETIVRKGYRLVSEA